MPVAGTRKNVFLVDYKYPSPTFRRTDRPPPAVVGICMFFVLPGQGKLGPDLKFRKFFRKLDGVIHFAFPEISAEI